MNNVFNDRVLVANYLCHVRSLFHQITLVVAKSILDFLRNHLAFSAFDELVAYLSKYCNL